MKRAFFAALFAAAALLGAQEFGFGFGEGESAPEKAPSLLPFDLTISGEIKAGPLLYVHDFKNGDNAELYQALDAVSAKLNFTAAGESAQAFVALNLSAKAVEELRGGGFGPSAVPRFLDEAYLRGFLGAVNIEAGLRKLTWGRADSFGPLDVVNPVDYSDLTGITDTQAVKIARPLVRLSWSLGDFSKLEAVFVPSFTGNRYDRQGRWTPAQFANMYGIAGDAVFARAMQLNPGAASGLASLRPSIEAEFMDYFSGMLNNGGQGLDYFQTGLRFTATAGSSDFGAQYYYGNIFRPAFVLTGNIDAFLVDLLGGQSTPPYSGKPELLAPKIEYNRYHQLGLDYARVLYGFNIRAEFAAHLTEDYAGDKGAVQNPFLAWSLGFDRDIAGVNVNIQCNETVRLLHDKIGGSPIFDCEAGDERTATRFIARLSKTFFRGKLECKAVNIWDIEDRSCYIIPSAAWTMNDMTAELSAGIFSGREAGELGQYWENSFIKCGVTYTF